MKTDKELLSDYRHLSCHFNAIYSNTLDIFSKSPKVVKEFIRLSKIASNSDETNNLIRSFSPYVKL